MNNWNFIKRLITLLKKIKYKIKKIMIGQKTIWMFKMMEDYVQNNMNLLKMRIKYNTSNSLKRKRLHATKYRFIDE